jgi:uncharacterized protein (TIGR02421 family)
MPFLVVHIGRRSEPAAREVVMANSAYLLVANLTDAVAVIRTVGGAMLERFGAFLVLDIGELTKDGLAQDAPYLAPFEVSASAPSDRGAQSALSALIGGIEKADARYRAPKVERKPIGDDSHAGLARRLPAFRVLTLRFAPIYKVPQSHATYPDLRERLVANIFDAALQAVAEFARGQTSLSPASHRALGRRVFVDAVIRADKAVDAIASGFDFLLAVTPINAESAWEEFRSAKFARAPHFLYRPLAIDIAASKKALFSIAIDHLEDPVLSTLYREKQSELDLQLSMLAAREGRQFSELGRALYRSVEPRLEKAARSILEATANRSGSEGDLVDHRFLMRRAQAMIDRYAAQSNSFTASIDVRDDLPAGMMVANGQLLISRNTSMARDRVEALLSHEVGVHLLTYFNGSGHGLQIFRSGLAGYEGAQEGLAVLAEYLAGGMTVARLRLLAARVLAVSGMLSGAGFADTFAMLAKEHGFSERNAFNIALRVHRGGGLAKDAIYLRGLFELLDHLSTGGSLDPFWQGKIASTHFATMQELSARGLLKAPRLMPQFLGIDGADGRLARLRTGLSPLDLIAA